MEKKKKSNLVILQINGPDRPNLFFQICQLLSNQNINILDVSQNVLRGYLGITFLLDLKNCLINQDRLELKIGKLCRDLNLTSSFFKYIEGTRPKIKNLYIFTIMGPDTIGLLSSISIIFAKHGSNNESISVKVRKNWIYLQILLDFSEVKDINALRNELIDHCEKLNLSLVLQKESIYRKNKKLIVFDMDSTLIKGETIVKMAKHAHREIEMSVATEKIMNSDLDFEKSLRQRAKLLKGLPVSALYDVAGNLEITSGAEELIIQLKQMGWKIALVSSGFSFFTDIIKHKLSLDYSYGNTLEIKDNKLTGEVLGNIIDGDGKWQIIEELSHQLGIAIEEIVTVGDGSNDRIMLERAGLGIGFNSKDIVNEVADGRIQEEDASMILLMLGLTETEINRILDK